MECFPRRCNRSVLAPVHAYSCAFRLIMVSCPAVPTSHAKVPEHAPIYDASSNNRTTRPRHGCAVASPICSDTNDVEPAASPSAPRSEPQPAISPRADVPREHHGLLKHDRIGPHGRGRRRLRARLRGVVQPRARRHAQAIRDLRWRRWHRWVACVGGGPDADGRMVGWVNVREQQLYVPTSDEGTFGSEGSRSGSMNTAGRKKGRRSGETLEKAVYWVGAWSNGLEGS